MSSEWDAPREPRGELVCPYRNLQRRSRSLLVLRSRILLGSGLPRNSTHVYLPHLQAPHRRRPPPGQHSRQLVPQAIDDSSQASLITRPMRPLLKKIKEGAHLFPRIQSLLFLSGFPLGLLFLQAQLFSLMETRQKIPKKLHIKAFRVEPLVRIGTTGSSLRSHTDVPHHRKRLAALHLSWLSSF
jgi:hypothetical protein